MKEASRIRVREKRNKTNIWSNVLLWAKFASKQSFSSMNGCMKIEFILSFEYLFAIRTRIQLLCLYRGRFRNGLF